MRSHRSWAVVLLSMVVVVIGPATTASGTTEPPKGSAPAGVAGCDEIGALLDSRATFAAALATGDPDVVAAVVAELSEIAAAAAGAAPAQIDAEVDTLAASVDATVAALEGVELSDIDAVLVAIGATESEASGEAFVAVIEWAIVNCGYDQPDPFADAPEPPDCETLEAGAAADAAGIDVDVTDLDGSADVSVPGFWTKSCSYGNGAMILSTLSFNSLENARQFYTDNLDTTRGVVLDVALRSLPESSLIIQTGAAVDGSVPSTDQPAASAPPTVQVTVFEAPVPFSVSFTGDDIDPAAVIAAAEALYAAPPGAEPPVTVVTTTA